MIESIDVPVSVATYFDHKKGYSWPVKVVWEGKEYLITKLGFHHTYYLGRVLHHVFSVATAETFFKLDLDSKSLRWRLKEVADGMAG